MTEVSEPFNLVFTVHTRVDDLEVPEGESLEVARTEYLGELRSRLNLAVAELNVTYDLTLCVMDVQVVPAAPPPECEAECIVLRRRVRHLERELGEIYLHNLPESSQ